MKELLIMPASFVILFTACQKASNVHSLNRNNLQISINTACGWCAPGDSMMITKAATAYKYYPSSCSKDGKLSSEATPAGDWTELLQLLDLEKFNAIKLNECNICVDGCDEWVTIQQGDYKHTIRYGSHNSEKLKEIKPFIEKLHVMRATAKAQVVK